MDGIERNEDQAREANELYWGSETSVNRIADQLGLSKGSLYAAIEPLPSESICPLCSAALAYSNRTALEKGKLQCSSCGTEFAEKTRASAPQQVSRQPRAVKTLVPDGPEADESVYVGASDSGPSRQLVWSTTMLGLGLGLLLHRVTRR